MKKEVYNSLKEAYREYREINESYKLYSNIFGELDSSGNPTCYWCDCHTPNSWSVREGADIVYLTDVRYNPWGTDYPRWKEVLKRAKALEKE